MGQYGISSVRMDDIAKECHISKRTLYEHIPDKRTLVWECVVHRQQKNGIEAKNLVSEANDTLQALLQIFRYMRKGMSDASTVFFKDMHHMYPDIAKRCQEQHQEEAKEFANFLLKGVDEGVFRNDLDFNLATKAFLTQSSAIIKELANGSNLQETLRMVDIIFVIFLRGIATSKGIDIIDSFLKEHNI